MRMNPQGGPFNVYEVFSGPQESSKRLILDQLQDASASFVALLEGPKPPVSAYSLFQSVSWENIDTDLRGKRSVLQQKSFKTNLLLEASTS